MMDDPVPDVDEGQPKISWQGIQVAKARGFAVARDGVAWHGTAWHGVCGPGTDSCEPVVGQLLID